jgi:DNA-binding GntR family transcriptional regulator
MSQPATIPFGTDRASTLPLHDQIYRLLHGMIVSGQLAPGEKLLQEKKYAARLGISLAPVRQAILALTKDGYLTRSRGRGTFVREPKVADKIQLLSSFSATLGATGQPVSMRVLAARIIPADEEVGGALGVLPGSELFHLRRVASLSDGTRRACLRCARRSPMPGSTPTTRLPTRSPSSGRGRTWSSRPSAGSCRKPSKGG